jgi:hypothetical protein
MVTVHVVARNSSGFATTEIAVAAVVSSMHSLQERLRGQFKAIAFVTNRLAYNQGDAAVANVTQSVPDHELPRAGGLEIVVDISAVWLASPCM